jgi:FkbM family methyltransferase
VIDIIPVLRGEITLKDGMAITTTKEQYPILIKKDDPIVGSKLRFSGDIRSLFAETAIFLAKSGDVVAEVGSHFGYNVIGIGHKLGQAGKYYAFEPNSGIAAWLRKSLVLNDLQEVVCLKSVAIANAEETIAIDDYLSIVKNEKGEFTKPRTIMVDCSTLDIELAGETRPVNMLLADIPGLEFSIIRGAKDIIDRSENIQIIISVDKAVVATKYNLRKELEKMQERGFLLYVAEGPHSCREVTVEEIISKNEAVIIMTKNKLAAFSKGAEPARQLNHNREEKK